MHSLGITDPESASRITLARARGLPVQADTYQDQQANLSLSSAIFLNEYELLAKSLEAGPYSSTGPSWSAKSGSPRLDSGTT
eukprot:scaffold172730_cov39-Prasinocladus_malaysianus.AAC.1